MSKAFITETDNDADDEPEISTPGGKNYMTPRGLADLQEEMRRLQRDERPKVVEIVHWAAGNGDRSENGDYIYNKRRLREIDRRLRYISKRLENAEVVDPRRQQGLDRVFFGATVTYAREDGTERTVTLVGVDEAELAQGKISWQSPVARALLKLQAGDTGEVRTESGTETLEVLDVSYRIDGAPA